MCKEKSYDYHMYSSRVGLCESKIKSLEKNSFNIQNITSLTLKLTAKHFRFTQTYTATVHMIII
jgi:hypothetical protein